MILVVDFGSQTTHLIARRVRDLGTRVEIITPELALAKIRQHKPRGVIFSGGPDFVNQPGSPTIDKAIFTLGIPILGICYGQQLTAYLLGGDVKPGKTKEFGPATLIINKPSLLFDSVSSRSRIWMSHGDVVVTPPAGFAFIGETASIKAAAMADASRKIYCVQFHPEVEHTEYGLLILKNFLEKICGLKLVKQKISLDSLIHEIRTLTKNQTALAAVSGGIDSTVAAGLVARAIGDKLVPVYVDNGLMRTDTRKLLESLFKTYFNIPLFVVEAQKTFLEGLKGITDPEEKRKCIGQLYIECFEKEARKHSGINYLVQGTIYSDVIESKGSQYAAKIKSHHNVGGLPQHMQLKLVEPLRNFYKDEVKLIGKKLGIPQNFLLRQPFPGPGYAIRILGEVTATRLKLEQLADQIVLEELEAAGWLKKVFQSFPVLTNSYSTAVKGDGRFYGEVVALRVYDSSDIMTAGWTRLPYAVLQKISSRIVNEIPGVSRVVYDITTKPPATMEWE